MSKVQETGDFGAPPVKQEMFVTPPELDAIVEGLGERDNNTLEVMLSELKTKIHLVQDE